MSISEFSSRNLYNAYQFDYLVWDLENKTLVFNHSICKTPVTSRVKTKTELEK